MERCADGKTKSHPSTSTLFGDKITMMIRRISADRIVALTMVQERHMGQDRKTCMVVGVEYYSHLWSAKETSPHQAILDLNLSWLRGNPVGTHS